jgi:hypothetical protein
LADNPAIEKTIMIKLLLLVTEKIRKWIMPPTLRLEELKSLGVLQ